MVLQLVGLFLHFVFKTVAEWKIGTFFNLPCLLICLRIHIGAVCLVSVCRKERREVLLLGWNEEYSPSQCYCNICLSNNYSLRCGTQAKNIPETNRFYLATVLFWAASCQTGWHFTDRFGEQLVIEEFTTYSVVQNFFALFEIPASFLPSKMASPCTANWSWRNMRY